MKSRNLFLVACALSLAACQQTPPPRRAGLWQETFARDGKSKELGMLRSVRLCLDPAVETHSPIFNHDAALKHAQSRHCQPPVANRGLDGIYNFGSTCPLPNGGGTVVIKGTGSGDFKRTYHLHLDTTVTYKPPFTPLNSHHTTDVDGAWLGPCQANMKPGDMILANGVRAPGGRIVDPHEFGLPR